MNEFYIFVSIVLRKKILYIDFLRCDKKISLLNGEYTSLGILNRPKL